MRRDNCFVCGFPFKKKDKIERFKPQNGDLSLMKKLVHAFPCNVNLPAIAFHDYSSDARSGEK